MAMPEMKVARWERMVRANRMRSDARAAVALRGDLLEHSALQLWRKFRLFDVVQACADPKNGPCGFPLD